MKTINCYLLKCINTQRNGVNMVKPLLLALVCCDIVGFNTVTTASSFIFGKPSSFSIHDLYTYNLYAWAIIERLYTENTASLFSSRSLSDEESSVVGKGRKSSTSAWKSAGGAQEEAGGTAAEGGETESPAGGETETETGEEQGHLMLNTCSFNSDL